MGIAFAYGLEETLIVFTEMAGITKLPALKLDARGDGEQAATHS